MIDNQNVVAILGLISGLGSGLYFRLRTDGSLPTSRDKQPKLKRERRGLPVELTEQLMRETTAERPVLIPYEHPPEIPESIIYADAITADKLFVHPGVVERRVSNMVQQQFIAGRLLRKD